MKNIEAETALRARLSDIFENSPAFERDDHLQKRIRRVETLVDGVFWQMRSAAQKMASEAITKELIELATGFEDGTDLRIEGDKLLLWMLHDSFDDELLVTVDLREIIMEQSRYLDNRDEYLSFTADNFERLAKFLREQVKEEP